MFRHWLTAVVIALLAWSGADAQSGKAQVDVRSGGVVVKKVIKNGEVVDEDVQVFGDLDEQLRDQILALVKRWRADGDRKATGATKRGRKPEKPDRKRGAQKLSCNSMHHDGNFQGEGLFYHYRAGATRSYP